jgi:hypothetical protein
MRLISVLSALKKRLSINLNWGILGKMTKYFIVYSSDFIELIRVVGIATSLKQARSMQREYIAQKKRDFIITKQVK